jgi:hypothetical protein
MVNGYSSDWLLGLNDERVVGRCIAPPPLCASATLAGGKRPDGARPVAETGPARIGP